MPGDSAHAATQVLGGDASGAARGEQIVSIGSDKASLQSVVITLSEPILEA
jgi:hypothetical protein